MTFERQETSVESGAPIALVKFTYGEGPSEFFAYTDFDSSVEHDDITYAPIVMGLGDVKAGGSVNDTDLVLQIDPNSPLVEFLKTRSLTQEVAVKIFAGHYDDEDQEFLPQWAGRLLSHNRKDRYTELMCQSVITTLDALSRTRTRLDARQSGPYSA